MPAEPRIFGEPFALPPALAASFRLCFRTEHLPLGWSQCSATANFLSAYYRGVFLAGRTAAETAELTHSIAYLANELLENVVKFRAPGDVELEAGCHQGEFLLRLTNTLAAETGASFQSVLAGLTAGDPGELLLERIEANAADESAGGSGLGLLTLMSDYGIRFCWTFTPDAAHDGRVRLQTLARLRLPS